jgi:hypothetical protein
LNFQNQALNDVDEESNKQTHFHNPDHDHGSHKMCSLVEHLSPIIRPDACIDADVNDEEANQEDPGEGHDKFFADRGSKKFRPFHMNFQLLEFIGAISQAKIQQEWLSVIKYKSSK